MLCEEDFVEKEPPARGGLEDVAELRASALVEMILPLSPGGAWILGLSSGALLA